MAPMLQWLKIGVAFESFKKLRTWKGLGGWESEEAGVLLKSGAE